MLARTARSTAALLVAWVAAMVWSGATGPPAQDLSPGRATAFDQRYLRYGELLATHVVDGRVDYRRLKGSRATLDAVVAELGRISKPQLARWSEDQQLAYWINAYNAFTLDAIVSHYPIRNRWFTIFGFVPPNSIKQIPGVWTRLRWAAGGAARTLDEIEHEIIRVVFDEPRIHFAVNCAAISCPPLRATPYVGRQLDAQLAAAARDFLDSRHGAVVEGSTLQVSRIFSWYGEDFIERYAASRDGGRSATERAILGVVAELGPPAAAHVARLDDVELEFLDYDWGLNDVVSP